MYTVHGRGADLPDSKALSGATLICKFKFSEKVYISKFSDINRKKEVV